MREVLKHFQLRPKMGYFSTSTGKGVNKSRAIKFLKEHLAVVDCAPTSTSDLFIVRYSSDLDPWSNQSIVHWFDGRIYVRKAITSTLVPKIKQEFLDAHTPGMNKAILYLFLANLKVQWFYQN